MSRKILNATFGLAGILGKPFGSSKKKPAATAAAPGPVVMPLADDEAIRRSRRKSLASMLNRGGRNSTMLTADSDTLGGS